MIVSRSLFLYNVQAKNIHRNYLKPLNFVRITNLISFRFNSNQDRINNPYLLLDQCLKTDFPKIHENTLIANDVIENFCKSYKSNLTDKGRTDFLSHLCKQFGVKEFEKTKELCCTFISEQNTFENLQKYADELHQATRPRYMDLFSMVGRLNDGVKFLINMRADVESSISKSSAENQLSLKLLSTHLKEVLSLWCSIGLLKLHKVDWNTSARVLEKVGTYEAVHYVRSWLDLKHRLAHDRRCFVLFHEAVPNEPFVVLHVALTEEISDSVDRLIRRSDCMTRNSKNNRITTAIFYSITSTQKGLKGIDFGLQTIYKAVEQLQSELPSITNFSSLSPIPMFCNWLQKKLLSHIESSEESFISEKDAEIIKTEFNLKDDFEMHQFLYKLLGNFHEGKSKELLEKISSPLINLCASYLCKEKRNTTGYSLDPVANFHLRNGAVIWRINWMADSTKKGFKQSLGMMVNYRYYINQLDGNRRTYLLDKQILYSENVKKLL